MHKYEIEIKSLLGSKTKADDLVTRMKQKDPGLKFLGLHKQLNHYFVGGDLKSLHKRARNLLAEPSGAKLKDLADKAKDFSVRTREADDKIILVVKATADDTTSENGIARLEWEHLMNLPLDGLDKLVLDAGFSYQAKWSRERSAYEYNISLPSPIHEERPKERLMTIAIDKNAGYGYLAEFEIVVDDEKKTKETKKLIRTVMADLEVGELSQDRLERMFDYYNKNWQKYYGTEKTFTIE